MKVNEVDDKIPFWRIFFPAPINVSYCNDRFRNCYTQLDNFKKVNIKGSNVKDTKQFSICFVIIRDSFHYNNNVSDHVLSPISSSSDTTTYSITAINSLPSSLHIS